MLSSRSREILPRPFVFMSTSIKFTLVFSPSYKGWYLIEYRIVTKNKSYE